MPLSDSRIQSAKPADKQYKLADGGGLHLLITPAGGKLWRFKYRINGKQKALALGKYPAVRLKAARAKRDRAKELLATGTDPGMAKKAARSANADTFEAVATEWLRMKSTEWSPAHLERVSGRLANHLTRYLGSTPITEVTASVLLAVLRKIEDRGIHETTRRVHQIAGQIMRYGVATGRLDRDPTADLRGALTAPQKRHMATITDPNQVGQLLRSIWDYPASPIVRAALQLGVLTFQRPGEIRTMLWADIDTEAAEWRFTASKTGLPHIVPLSHQAMEVIEGLRPLTGRGDLVLPSARGNGRPLSDNGARTALRSMGYGPETITPHGFRAMARTLLDEVLNFRPDYVEQQLAHAVRDPLGRAYNRTKHLEPRRAMMQAWADYLDNLREGSNVIGIGVAR